MRNEVCAQRVHAAGAVGTEVALKLRLLAAFVLPVLVQPGPVGVPAAAVRARVRLLPFAACHKSSLVLNHLSQDPSAEYLYL